MAKDRVSRRQAPAQFPGAADALSRLKTAQAASWLLEQFYINDLSGDFARNMSQGVASLPSDEIRERLTWLAIEAINEELAEARALLEPASSPQAVA